MQQPNKILKKYQDYIKLMEMKPKSIIKHFLHDKKKTNNAESIKELRAIIDDI